MKFRSRLRKTKTDPLDARSIADMHQKRELKSFSRVPGEETFELRLLVRHRWRLVDTITNLKRVGQGHVDQLFPELEEVMPNLWSATCRALIREPGIAPVSLLCESEKLPEIVRRASRGRVGLVQVRALVAAAKDSIGITRGIEVLEQQLVEVLQIIEHLETHCRRADQRLQGIVEEMDSPLLSLGLGPALAATIHAETDPITDFASARQYVAYCGLDPSTSQSGEFKNTTGKISKRGSTHLRRALYLAAAGLYRHVPDLKRRYDRDRAKGKHHNHALIVVAHKLARIIFRMLTDDRPFRRRPPARKRR